MDLYTAKILVTISLCVLGAFSEKALAQAQVTGEWVTLPYLMPINPIRVGLLRPSPPTAPGVISGLRQSGQSNDPAAANSN